MFWLTAFLLAIYGLITLGLSRKLPKLQSQNWTRSRERKFSLIVAMRNEEEHLDLLLSQLNRISYSDNMWELILVDDHSEDASVEFATQYQKNFNCRIIPNRGEGKKDALSTGIEVAKYEEVLFTDADCALPQYIFQYYSTAYKESDVLLGPVKLMGQGRIFDYFQEVDFAVMQIWTALALQSEKLFLANGANLSYKKEIFEEQGGYKDRDIPSGDDILFLQQVKDQKMEFVWNQDCIVKTPTQLTLKGFVQQRLRWASKSSKYNSRYAQGLSIFFFVLNFVLFIDFFVVPTEDKGIDKIVFLLLVKFLIETTMLFPTLTFFSLPRRYLLLILFQVPHIVYMASIGLLSQILPYRWKGRKHS